MSCCVDTNLVSPLNIAGKLMSPFVRPFHFFLYLGMAVSEHDSCFEQLRGLEQNMGLLSAGLTCLGETLPRDLLRRADGLTVVVVFSIC